MVQATINSVKHFVTSSNTDLAGGSTREIVLVNAITKDAQRGFTSDVSEGAIVKAVHCELWLNGRGSNTTVQFVAVLLKLPAGVARPDANDMVNLQAYPNKKNILYTTQGVLDEQGSQSIPIMRSWFKIPKGKQRFGLGDQLSVVILALGADMANCSIYIYKEYY